MPVIQDLIADLDKAVDKLFGPDHKKLASYVVIGLLIWWLLRRAKS